MIVATDSTGHATIVVSVNNLERGRFRIRGMDGIDFAPDSRVEIADTRIQSVVVRLNVLVADGETYECRGASDPHL